MKPARGNGESKALSIGALSRATRIPVETLRTWERRYGSPKPVRKPSGHRLYPAESVEHLRRVGRLLTHGHRPGEILGLSLRELDALIEVSDPEPKRAVASDSIASASEPIPRSIEATLRAAGDLDRERVMRELSVNWARLGPVRFLQDFAGPLMVEIGRAWELETLDVRHEHFVSSCLSSFLREVREPFDHVARGPRVVVATLPGDSHEGGLLMLSTLLAFRGYRVIYLGANTPVEQIAAAATTGAMEIVAVSVSLGLSRTRAGHAVTELRALLPHRIPLWVGGAGAPASTQGVERFESLVALDRTLTP